MWKTELRRHCEVAYDDSEEDATSPSSRTQVFKTTGEEIEYESGLMLSISVDLVLKAISKMSTDQADGPGDQIASEINVTHLLRQRIDGAPAAPESSSSVKLVFLRKPDALETKNSWSVEDNGFHVRYG